MKQQNILKIGSSFLALAGVLFNCSFPAGEAAAQTRSSRLAPSGKKRTLCADEEQTIWSCMTRRNKIASLCGSKDLTDQTGYLEYRFGLPGKIDFAAPEDRERSQEFFRYSRQTRPLVTMLTLRFTSGGYLYEIHADDNAEGSRQPISAWIDVLDDKGKTVSSVDCRLPIFGSLMKLEDIVPQYEEDEN